PRTWAQPPGPGRGELGFPHVAGDGWASLDHERHVGVRRGQLVTGRDRPDAGHARVASWTAAGPGGRGLSRDAFRIEASACWIQLVELATRGAPDHVDRRPHRRVFDLPGTGPRGAACRGRTD